MQVEKISKNMFPLFLGQTQKVRNNLQIDFFPSTLFLILAMQFHKSSGRLGLKNKQESRIKAQSNWFIL